MAPPRRPVLRALLLGCLATALLLPGAGALQHREKMERTWAGATETYYGAGELARDAAQREVVGPAWLLLGEAMGLVLESMPCGPTSVLMQVFACWERTWPALRDALVP